MHDVNCFALARAIRHLSDEKLFFFEKKSKESIAIKIIYIFAT
jgi:hypothetical protein